MSVLLKLLIRSSFACSTSTVREMSDAQRQLSRFGSIASFILVFGDLRAKQRKVIMTTVAAGNLFVHADVCTWPLFRRLFHIGPITALTIIFAITTAAIVCAIQWWPPLNSLGGLLNAAIFLFWVFLTLLSFVNAADIGPGYLKLAWKPENEGDSAFLQFCPVCNGCKAPRSHHCRKCQRCVLKMDHHCPWINNCVGHFNQFYFIKFLFFAVIGCSHAVAIMGPSIYRAIFRVRYLMYGNGIEPIVNLGLYSIVAALFASGLAIGVICSVGFLCIIQVRSVLRNRTSIEDWILVKALHRRKHLVRNSDSESSDSEKEDDVDQNHKSGLLTVFVYPYDLGRRLNLLEVFTFSGLPRCNGVVWPVVPGCDQFTLTLEQLHQKKQKQHHALTFVCLKPYGGAWFPVSFGCKAFYCIPFTDEPRLPLRLQDRVKVTRWKRHWLYGEQVSKELHDANGKGMFGLPDDGRLSRLKICFYSSKRRVA